MEFSKREIKGNQDVVGGTCLKLPTLSYWPNDIDYILFMDESGTKSITDFGEKGEYPIFVLCGCLIHKHNYSNLVKSFLNTKESFWPPDGKFKGRRVCFISSKIRRREGPFGHLWLNDDKKTQFYENINNIIISTDFNILASVIDKGKLSNKYIRPEEPYNLAFKFIIERFLKFLAKKNKIGVMIIESRNLKENSELLTLYHSYMINGTNYVSASQLRKYIKGMFFVPKWDSKGKSYTGVELADLCAYPLGTWYLGRKTKATEIISQKLLNYPEYKGYGLKIFP